MSEARLAQENSDPAADEHVTLETGRLYVRSARSDDVPAIIRYYKANRERLRAFDPLRPDFFFEERFWKVQVRQNLDDIASDRSVRLFLFPKDEPARVIGNVGLSNIVRGAGQYCTMGYGLDGDFEGKGLMKEALEAVTSHAFDVLHLHRIEANYMPHNTRSAGLLRRLGFTVEGYSRDYLRINGEWEDHIRTGLINPRWIDS